MHISLQFLYGEVPPFRQAILVGITRYVFKILVFAHEMIEERTQDPVGCASFNRVEGCIQISHESESGTCKRCVPFSLVGEDSDIGSSGVTSCRERSMEYFIQPWDLRERQNGIKLPMNFPPFVLLYVLTAKILFELLRQFPKSHSQSCLTRMYIGIFVGFQTLANYLVLFCQFSLVKTLEQIEIVVLKEGMRNDGFSLMF